MSREPDRRRRPRRRQTIRLVTRAAQHHPVAIYPRHRAAQAICMDERDAQLRDLAAVQVRIARFRHRARAYLVGRHHQHAILRVHVDLLALVRLHRRHAPAQAIVHIGRLARRRRHPVGHVEHVLVAATRRNVALAVVLEVERCCPGSGDVVYPVGRRVVIDAVLPRSRALGQRYAAHVPQRVVAIGCRAPQIRRRHRRQGIDVVVRHRAAVDVFLVVRDGLDVAVLVVRVAVVDDARVDALLRQAADVLRQRMRDAAAIDETGDRAVRVTEPAYRPTVPSPTCVAWPRAFTVYGSCVAAASG